MTTSAAPILLHQFPGSGHCHRVRLLLSLLNLPYTVANLDRTANPQKTPAFLAKNPFGQVPVIEDEDITLADSNAILVYLATRYDDTGRWLPRDPIGAAQVQRWLSIAAGELASGPMILRRLSRIGGNDDPVRATAITEKLFTLMNDHLADRPFLVGDDPTLADVALYSYTSLAPEGGLPLSAWPHVQAWLARIEALPGFIPV